MAAGGLTVLVMSACEQAPASPQAVVVASSSPIPAAATGTAPAPRAGAALEYDPLSQQLLLIGGMADPSNPPPGEAVPGRDFWGWTPAWGWTLLQPPNLPAASYQASMVWDATVGRVVLLSGAGGEVWDWDGVRWTDAGAAPRTDVAAGVSYDTADGRLLLLARPPGEAYPPPASGARLSPASSIASAYQGEAMWSWDGTSWSESLTPMSWREQAAVAYDQDQRQLVVYGGYGDGGTTTWLWDGAAWSERQTPAFAIANQSSAAYDPIRHQVIMYAPGGETWSWDGATWEKQSTMGPGYRRDQSMAFDAAIGEVVMFGGKSPPVSGSDEVFHNDLWAWDGLAWRQLA